MDAEHSKKLRTLLSLKQRRWSMNSQRLEEIVAALMKPISDTHNFDTDLSALLEEYFTEAGLHALGMGDGGAEGEEVEGATPNYPEVALLLQQSAIIYSRKVDFLYRHVLSIKTSLQQTARDDDDTGNDNDPERLSAEARRKRRSSVREAAEFCEVEVAAEGAGVRREGAPGDERPPPTLPRLYLELQPRVPHERDPALADYKGEAIGLLADFHAAWRLREGLLVEDLAVTTTSCVTPPPVSPPPAVVSPPPAPPSLPPSPAPPSPAVAAVGRDKDRPNKRKMAESEPPAFNGSLQIDFSIATLMRLRRRAEYSVPPSWVRRVVARRAAEMLKVRRSSQLLLQQMLSAQQQHQPAHTDHELSSGMNDDDGFDEPSAGWEEGAGPAQLQDWAERVMVEALEKEAKHSMDLPALRRLVQRAVPEPCAPPRPVRHLLLEHAQHPRDVSRIFLTTLILATEGSVQVCDATPLALGAFSVRACPPSAAPYPPHKPPPHRRAPR